MLHTDNTVPSRCYVCNAPLYEDALFNEDMLRAGLRRFRLRCVNDHGFIMEGPPPRDAERARRCETCGLPLEEDLPLQTKHHPGCRKHRAAAPERRRRFKSGFIGEDNV
jgi:hypothetical protein